MPPVQALRTHAQAAVQGPGVPITSPRLITLSLVIYHIIKTRGYKTIGGALIVLHRFEGPLIHFCFSAFLPSSGRRPSDLS